MAEACWGGRAPLATVSKPLSFGFPVQSPLVPAWPEPPVEVVLWRDSIPGWLVKLPLLVRIVRDSDGYFNAGDDVFVVYGDGQTRAAALEAYQVALLEFYEIVAAGAPTNPYDQQLLARLQQYLVPG